MKTRTSDMPYVWKTTGQCLSKPTGEIILFIFISRCLQTAVELYFNGKIAETKYKKR